jgi:hypothetical protein
MSLSNSNHTAPRLAETAPPSRGLTLPCPKCGEEDAAVSLHLDDGETLHCRDCDNEFTLDDIRNFITRWQAVLAWVDAMPGG